MAVIEVTGAHKTYRRFRKPPEKAVDGLDLVVEQGGVHGFLGPNGSGKTTTIRMLLGLVGSDGGDLRVFGRPVPARTARGGPPHRGPGRDAVVLPQLHRAPEPAPARRRRRGLHHPGRGVPGDRRPARAGRRQVQGLLPRHEAAPRDRGRPAQEPTAAHPRRAEQRAGPPGHRRRSRAASSARLRRPHHGLPVQPPARRGPAGLRPRDDPRPWSAGRPRPRLRRARCLVVGRRTAAGRRPHGRARGAGGRGLPPHLPRRLVGRARRHRPCGGHPHARGRRATTSAS